MTAEQLKQKIFSDKIRPILTSDFEYVLRETCDFIIDIYQTINNKLADSPDLQYLLPVATLDNFSIKTSAENSQLIVKVREKLSSQQKKSPELQLIDYVKDEENTLLALIFFKHSALSLAEIKEKIALLTVEQKEEYFEQYFKQPLPLQELDFFSYTFEFCTDFLTLRQIKKYHYNSFILQDLSINNSYFTPPTIIEAGFQAEFIQVMKKAIDTLQKISPAFPQKAKYLIPIAFLQKILFNININQLIKLDLPIAQNFWSAIKQVHPTIYKGVN